VFVHGVVTDLLGGKWQTVVEGKIPTRQSHEIESFIEENLAQADEFLMEKHGIPTLFSWLCNHVCVRWSIGARWISRIENGEYKIDCLPVDMRWTPFVRNSWVAPITFREGDDLKQELEEYEKIAKDNKREFIKVPLNDGENEVRDFWDKENEELWVGGKLVFTQPHKFGKPPFVIVTPARGFMLRDRGFLKHEGEDILFLNAGLYKEFARSVSLEQTSGYAGLYPGYEKEREFPDGSPSQPPPALAQSIDVKKGERHLPVPRGDINRAGQTARVDIQAMINNGAPLAPREYNTPPSAILLAGETELIGKLQNASKDALGIFRSHLSRMIIEQFILVDKGKAEILIGKHGKRRKYSASKLGNPDDYTITYHLSVKSKRQELANLAEFTAAYGRLPLRWNLTNILMADDPDGIIKELDFEKAEQINPALSLLKMAIQYAREAVDIEDEVDAWLKRGQSKILTHEYVMAMRQRTQPQETEQPKGNTQLLSSLAMKGMGGEGGAPKQPEEVVK